MAPRIPLFWEGYITALSDAKYSHSQIIAMCKQRSFVVSKWTINRVIKNSQQNQISAERTTPEARKQRPAPSRTREVLKTVSSMARKENPATQRSIARATGISQRTVGRIIKQNLGLVKRHKAKVHKLTSKHIHERKTNCRKLYERHLAGDRWKKIVTLDEAWIYLNDTNKPRAIFYRPRDAKGRSEWFRQCKENFSKGFMVVAGYCYQGKLTLRKVEKNAKVNAAYYQENILDPLYLQDIPALYGEDVQNVWLHQDKASSHTAKSTVAYMKRMAEQTKIRAIPFSSVPVKSPDASPMDFCGFGLLKRALGNRRPRTIPGLWKACQEEWNALPLVTLQRSLLQWKLRCRAIARMHGHQIEHNRWWRRGFS